MKETVKIPFKDKIIALNFAEWEDEIDIDELTFVDYSNLHAEFLTISSLYNRVGLWRAEAESQLDEAKLLLKITEAEKGEYYREDLREVLDKKVKTPTIAAVNDAVTMDDLVKKLRKKVIRANKNFNYMDALFWAVKSKEKKIDKLVEGSKLSPDDFANEIVEGKWNGILIKCREKLIK